MGLIFLPLDSPRIPANYLSVLILQLLSQLHSSISVVLGGAIRL